MFLYLLLHCSALIFEQIITVMNLLSLETKWNVHEKLYRYCMYIDRWRF